MLRQTFQTTSAECFSPQRNGISCCPLPIQSNSSQKSENYTCNPIKLKKHKADLPPDGALVQCFVFFFAATSRSNKNEHGVQRERTWMIAWSTKQLSSSGLVYSALQGTHTSNRLLFVAKRSLETNQVSRGCTCALEGLYAQNFFTRRTKPLLPQPKQECPQGTKSPALTPRKPSLKDKIALESKETNPHSKEDKRNPIHQTETKQPYCNKHPCDVAFVSCVSTSNPRSSASCKKMHHKKREWLSCKDLTQFF